MSCWAELADVSLAYEMSGQGSSLVLIHELGGSLRSFDAVAALVEGRHRVLRYDQRGAGLSEKPRQPFSLDDLLRDLHGVLAHSHLPPPYLLAGAAAGAAVAVAMALDRPASVRGLLLCAPALTVPPDRRSYLADRSALAAREGMRAIEAATLERSYPAALRDRALFDAYRARFLGNDPVSYGHANMALADADLDGRLGQVATPCHVLAGRHDVLRPPEQLRDVAARIPGARFSVVDSGHLMPVQAPEAIAAALEAFDRS